MTRINVVHPLELTDQHLIAEYREIFMVLPALKRSMNSKTLIKIPEKFTLNKGHVKFFYNKGLYLFKRYQSLIHEMRERGFNPDPERTFDVRGWPAKYWLDWEPTCEDMDIVRERINQRIDERPGWYKYCGELIDA